MQLCVGFFYCQNRLIVSSFCAISFLYLSKLNQIMKTMKLTVHLYYGGAHPSETKHTNDIDQARRWVADAEHGEIINSQNISVE